MVMYPPGVIEICVSPFRYPVFSHINGRVAVLFLYPPQELSEAEGCHLEPEGPRVQPGAVGY